MTLEELIPSAAAVIPTLTTVILAVATFYFKWLIRTFRTLETQIAHNGNIANEIQKSLLVMINNHEIKDQTRHEENLYRFEKISVALARLGSTNGTHDGKN